MRIVVIGAAGFVGSALLERLAGMKRLPGATSDITEIVAVDASGPATSGPHVRHAVGNISEPDFCEGFLADHVDCLFHLAAIPGGAAARDYQLGWSVNVEAVAGIFEKLAAQAKAARLVFSSSIAVFGTPLPGDKVDDETLPLPTMSYGAQKLIGETLLTDFSRRGLIDGVSVRLPGIVARPRAAGGHISAFMSNIFHALAAGEEFTLPVSAEATTWLMSRERCVDNLIHAASLPAEKLAIRRAFNLPALRLAMPDIAEAMETHFRSRLREKLRFEPDPEIEAQFGSYPPLLTPIADGLGFTHDGTPAEIAARALGLVGEATGQARGAA